MVPHNAVLMGERTLGVQTEIEPRLTEKSIRRLGSAGPCHLRMDFGRW